jgi:hypothetical protein
VFGSAGLCVIEDNNGIDPGERLRQRLAQRTRREHAPVPERGRARRAQDEQGDVRSNPAVLQPVVQDRNARTCGRERAHARKPIY